MKSHDSGGQLCLYNIELNKTSKIKNIIILSIAILIMGCVENKKNESVIENDTIQKDSLVTELSSDEDFSIYERGDFNYSGYQHVIKTIPYIDSVTKENMVEIKLFRGKDTICMKKINADSLLNSIIVSDRINESISIEELKKYHIVDVVPLDGVRDYRSYFIAKLSNNTSKNIGVFFDIKVYSQNNKIRIWDYSYGDSGYNQAKEELIKYHQHLKKYNITL